MGFAIFVWIKFGALVQLETLHPVLRCNIPIWKEIYAKGIGNSIIDTFV
jgi:hypothetical protein